MNARFSWQILLFALLAVVAVPAALAQKPSNTGPKYDHANEIKIKGVIDDIRETPGEFEGTHLLVKTDTGTLLVCLAPASFLTEIDASFKKGDMVEITGAKSSGVDGEEVLAREITVGSNTTILRDDAGVPVWAGWKVPKSK